MLRVESVVGNPAVGAVRVRSPAVAGYVALSLLLYSKSHVIQSASKGHSPAVYALALTYRGGFLIAVTFLRQHFLLADGRARSRRRPCRVPLVKARGVTSLDFRDSSAFALGGLVKSAPGTSGHRGARAAS